MFPLKFQGLINPAQMNLLSLLQGKKADNQPDLGQMADKVGLFDRVFNNARAESTAASPQAAEAVDVSKLIFELGSDIIKGSVSPEWEDVKVGSQFLTSKLFGLFSKLSAADEKVKNNPEVIELAKKIDNFIRSETPSSTSGRTAFEMIEKLEKLIDSSAGSSPSNPVGGIGATPPTELPPTVPAEDASQQDVMDEASRIASQLRVRSTPYGGWNERASAGGDRISDFFEYVAELLKDAKLPQKELNAIMAELKSIDSEMSNNKYPDDAAFGKVLNRVKDIISTLKDAQ